MAAFRACSGIERIAVTMDGVTYSARSSTEWFDNEAYMVASVVSGLFGDNSAQFFLEVLAEMAEMGWLDDKAGGLEAELFALAERSRLSNAGAETTDIDDKGA